jgi:iron complex outermembrane receptor protein
MKTQHRTLVSLVSLVSLVTFASILPGAAFSAAIEEIVIMARKVEENLQEVPISVTAFSAEFLERKGLDTVNELGAFTPNLLTTPGPSGSGRGANYYIRGIGQTDWIPTQNPGVGTYLDGVYLGRTTGMLLDLADIERVEVLRGPQGILFGKNTIGGAIQVIAKKPGPEKEGFGEITFGRYNRIDTKFSLNAPLSDNLFARFSGLARSNDGFSNRIVDGKDAGDDQDVGGRFALQWNVSEDFSAFVSVDGTRRRAHPIPHSLVEGSTVPVPIPADPRENIAAGVVPWKDELDAFGVSGVIDWNIGAIQFKSITAYRDMEIAFGADFDGSPVHSNQIDLSSNQDQISQELQLTGTLLNSRLDWLLGFYFLEEEFDFTNITINGPGPRDIGTIDVVEQKTTNYSVFAHGTWHATDALDISPGLRYTDEEKDAFLTSPLVFATGRDVSLRFDDTTPLISIDYKLMEDFMVYAIWSEGFKSGGVNGRIVPEALNTDTFNPEEVTAWELGFKSEWFENRLRLNASGFFSEYDDFQTVTLILDSNGVPFSPVSNAGDVDVFGFEVELEGAITDTFRVIASVGWTDENVTRVDPESFAFTFNENTELPGSPEWNTYLGAEYSIPVDWGSLFKGSFVIDADWSYRDEHVFLSILDPASTQSTYSLVDARLSFAHEDQGWEVAVWGKNIFDEEYAVFRQNLGGPPFPLGQSFNLAAFGRPAEYGITSRVRL